VVAGLAAAAVRAGETAAGVKLRRRIANQRARLG